MSFVEWFIFFVYKIKTYPLIIQITIVLTLVFIIATIALMITIGTIRRRHNKLQKKLKNSVSDVVTLFSEILFTERVYSEQNVFTTIKFDLNVVTSPH